MRSLANCFAAIAAELSYLRNHPIIDLAAQFERVLQTLEQLRNGQNELQNGQQQLPIEVHQVRAELS